MGAGPADENRPSGRQKNIARKVTQDIDLTLSIQGGELRKKEGGAPKEERGWDGREGRRRAGEARRDEGERREAK